MYSNAINRVALVCRAVKGLSTVPALLKSQVPISFQCWYCCMDLVKLHQISIMRICPRVATGNHPHPAGGKDIVMWHGTLKQGKLQL